MTVTVDTSEIRKLSTELERRAVVIESASRTMLATQAASITAEARGIAASYHGTGELAAATTWGQSGDGVRVFAEVRQAFFLEYGSPTTGAPRPWLSGPAARGQTALLASLGKIAAD